LNAEEHPYDVGAQNERTSLAWTRTGLALLVGVVLAVRLTADRLGIAVALFASVMLPVAVGVLVMAARRYRAAHSALHAGRALPSGRLPGLVAAMTCLLGVLEIAYALAD
jgi:putative membrane protein